MACTKYLNRADIGVVVYKGKKPAFYSVDTIVGYALKPLSAQKDMKEIIIAFDVDGTPSTTREYRPRHRPTRPRCGVNLEAVCSANPRQENENTKISNTNILRFDRCGGQVNEYDESQMVDIFDDVHACER